MTDKLREALPPREFLEQPDILRGHIIDIVTRKDGVERRYQADWIKELARAALQDQTAERCPACGASTSDDCGLGMALCGWQAEHRPTCGGTGRKDAPTYDEQKVQPSLAPNSIAELEELVDHGYGNTITEVAKYLIQRELDDLKRAGVVGTDRKDAQDPSTSANCLARDSSAVSGAGVEEAWERFKDTRSRDPEYGITHHDLKDTVEFGIKWQSSLQRDGWRPIEELPEALKDGRYVFLLSKDRYSKDKPEHRAHVGWWGQEDRREWCGPYLTSHHDVTHYMEVPTPPTTEEEGR